MRAHARRSTLKRQAIRNTPHRLQTLKGEVCLQDVSKKLWSSRGAGRRMRDISNQWSNISTPLNNAAHPRHSSLVKIPYRNQKCRNPGCFPCALRPARNTRNQLISTHDLDEQWIRTQPPPPPCIGTPTGLLQSRQHAACFTLGRKQLCARRAMGFEFTKKGRRTLDL